MTDANKYTAKLQDKRILVIGGSSGIGFAVAEASIESGAVVVISSSNQNKINKAVEKILSSYPSAKDRISGFACNLSNASTLEENVIALLNNVRKVDHIVHTAGDPLSITSLAEVTVEGAIKASMVRYYAPLIIGKHAAKYLNSGPYSSLVLTTGAITDRPMPNWVLTNAVMCGVEGLMRGLALDLAPIRVNIVNPGAIETELWNHMDKNAFDKFKGEVIENSTTGRLGQPDDVAEAYLYAMKDPNVTGTVIRSNSGVLLK